MFRETKNSANTVYVKKSQTLISTVKGSRVGNPQICLFGVYFMLVIFFKEAADIKKKRKSSKN